MTLRGNISNAHIPTEGYAGNSRREEPADRVRSSEKRASYDCLPPDSP